MLDTLKILIGRTDQDSLLTELLKLAMYEFRAYCNRDDIPEYAETIIINMVMVKYNRLNTEGYASESYNGASTSYIDGYPADILQQMKMYRKVRTI